MACCHTASAPGWGGGGCETEIKTTLICLHKVILQNHDITGILDIKGYEVVID